MKVALNLGQNVNPSSTSGRLHAVHVVAPPGTSRPPSRTHPDIRVLSHVVQAALESSNALGIASSAELAKETLELVVLEPLGGSLETLLENGAADAVSVGAG